MASTSSGVVVSGVMALGGASRCSASPSSCVALSPASTASPAESRTPTARVSPPHPLSLSSWVSITRLRPPLRRCSSPTLRRPRLSSHPSDPHLSLELGE
jgi:hypothetical protein